MKPKSLAQIGAAVIAFGMMVFFISLGIAAVPKTNAPATNPPVQLLSVPTNPPPVLPPPEPTVTVAQANAFADIMFNTGVRCALAAERLYPEIHDTETITLKARSLFQSQK